MGARFEVGEIVRVVAAMANPFWGYTGKVLRVFDGDLITGRVHYQIGVTLLNTDENTLLTMPLLFDETWLAYAGNIEEAG